MKRASLCAALAAALCVTAGCGDNSKICGPGTADTDGDGACEPSAGGPMCSDGTILDPGSNRCVIDPASCQDGTVLIHGRCVDPTEGLVIDLTEGPEPNNRGVGGVEPSGAIAGQIALPAPGQPFVVKGTIDPFRDADDDGELDPDMDLYEVTVDAPALLDVSVDGVGGLMGAFLIVPTGANPAAAWRRFGLNVTGDTSRRRIYLPAAGTYGLSVGDTRSMFVDAASPPAAGSAAAGGPGAHYFLSLTVLPAPAPAALTVTGGTATDAGTLDPGDVRLFTAPLGAGVNTVELALPGTPQASIVVVRNGAFDVEASEPPGQPARADTGGWQPGDAALIVADTVYHYGPGGAAYALTVTPRDALSPAAGGGPGPPPGAPAPR